MTLLRRWWWALLLIPVIIGATRLRLDVEVLNLLPANLPVVQGLKLYQENFSNARELIITLEGHDPNALENAARTVADALRRRTNLVSHVTWQPAWLEYPGQSAELIGYLWYNQPASSFALLTNRLFGSNLTNALIEAQQRLATTFTPGDIATLAYDPLELTRLPGNRSAADEGSAEQLFVSPDGRFRVVFVEADSPLANYKQCRAWLSEIQALVNRQALPADIRVSYTGRPAFVTEIAGGMERDMAGSAGGTLLTIGILFYLTHRRLRPLLWLLALLVLLLGATAGLGGLFFGTLNVVSLGFASILAGLAEDFGIVLYQESRSHPELTTQEVRRQAAPGIWWSAITTAGAFMLLNLSGLPGLGQLGSLVAIGILLAAVVMIYAYVPPLMRWHRKTDPLSQKFMLFAPVRLLPAKAIWAITVLLLLLAAFTLWQPRTRFDRSPAALKPKNSAAYATVEQIKHKLGRPDEPVWVIVQGKNEREVAERLTLVEPWLQSGVSNGAIARFNLPTQIWPQPQNQNANRQGLSSLVARAAEVRSAILAHGFTTNSLALTENLFATWRDAVARDTVYWPSNAASRWALDKFVGQTRDGILALGLIHPAADRSAIRRFIDSLPADLERASVIVSGWEFLGPTIFAMVIDEFPRVFVPIAVLVLLSLWLAFRHFREVLLSLATLGFAALALQAIMDVLGWRWNLLNLMALPLLLGMGIDYSIHIQLALRRYQGDLAAVRKSVGRALLLAGTTTVVGFGSLSFSQNAGMASLGQVCALGIALALLTAVYLLPVWWRRFGSKA
jgi:predicted RND superfamily exporter protein